MNRMTINFEELVDKVQRHNNFSLILQKQVEKYDLQPYKIQQSEAMSMLKIYKNIENKYRISGELTVDQNNWNQNERRLFVWYIITFCYFMELDNQQITQQLWDDLSPIFFSKKPQFLKFQYLNLLKSKKRISWTPEEDKLLIQSIQQEKPGKWNQISKRMFYVSNRTVFRSPKHCRERWLNHLDVSKKHGEWTHSEDLIIFKYVCQNGKKWSKVVPLLNETRTEHMIKNRFNSLINKSKASKKQKEEDAAKKVYKQLLRSVQNDQSTDSKSPSLKNQNTVLQDKIDTEQVQTQPKESSQENNETKANFVSVTYPATYNYGCYLDYNSYFLMNQLYCPPTYSPNAQIAVNPQQLLFSKNSCFTPYQQNV